MAGRGSRFKSNGFDTPKPLIPIHSIPMIRLVIDNLKPKSGVKFIFLCLREHVEKFGLRKKFQDWAPGSEIVIVDKVTKGAACTVLLAKDLINNNHPLMIANSDQWIDFEIDLYLDEISDRDSKGTIMTMKANDPKWSYTKVSEKGYVTSVVEKEVISDEATVGIYNFKYGSDFVDSALEMIEKDKLVNGEFYVAPVYNEMINKGMLVDIYNIGEVGNGMYGLGTPNDLNNFIKSPVSKKATSLLRN